MIKREKRKCKYEGCPKYVNEGGDWYPWVEHGLCEEHYKKKMKPENKKRGRGIRGSNFR